MNSSKKCDVFSFVFWKNPWLDNLLSKLTDLYFKSVDRAFFAGKMLEMEFKKFQERKINSRVYYLRKFGKISYSIRFKNVMLSNRKKILVMKRWI